MSDPANAEISEALRGLLARLDAPGADPLSVVQEWQASRRPANVSTALRRLSLARRFDKNLFAKLTSDLGLEEPSFERFVERPEIVRTARHDYIVAEDTRNMFLAQWRGDPEWGTWNGRLAEWTNELDAGDVVGRLCYLLRSDRDAARRLFEDEFAKAENLFDLARCFALLEVLTQAQQDLGPEFAGSRRTHEQRYRALAYVSSDYYRTRTYQRRPGAVEAIDRVLASDDRRILQLHATGGMGKTMFLRWFVAEQLLRKGVACARVDFDDVNTENVARHPWLLLLPFAEQLNLQLSEPFFSELLDQLSPFAQFLWMARAAGSPRSVPLESASTAVTPENEPGSIYIKKFVANLRQADSPAVLILDTLEGMMLASNFESNFESIFGMLSDLHAGVPKLRVVLAGRYHMSRKIGERMVATRRAGAIAAPPGAVSVRAARLLKELNEDSVEFHLTRFTDDEVRTYLESRGITAPAIVQAIVEKVRETIEPGAPDETSEPDAPAGSNPFTLSLFADLVLGRDGIGVEEIRALPSAHFIYLIERVIKRIPDQPLRWVVRYGAMPRRLTRDFVEGVLLDPLVQALRGDLAEDRPAVQTRGSSEIREPDEWFPDPDAKTDTLWEDLCRYESPRGWIWRTPGREDCVQFHGDVVDPMRDLLSSQAIFPTLQRAAAVYFEQAARNDPSHWPDWTCEAIFHRFQLEGDAAVPYWEEQLRVSRTKGNAAWPRQIAHELLRREYAVEERVPLQRGEPASPIISLHTLARAHAETARAILDESGHLPTSHEDWPAFTRHVAAAQELFGAPATAPLSAALLAQHAASVHSTNGDNVAAERVLSHALVNAAESERFGLHLQLAHTQAALGHSSAFEHMRAAMAAYPGAGVTHVTLVDLRLDLARWYRSGGAVTRADESFKAALELAGSDQRAAVKVRMMMAWEDLHTWHFERAQMAADEVRASAPDTPLLPQLDAWIALSTGDPERAFTLSAEGVARSASPRQEAYARDLLAKVEAERMNFSRAFTEWEHAIRLFAQTPAPNAIESCTLDRLVVEGRVMASYDHARNSLAGLERLPGMRDAEIGARANVERMFLDVQAGNREAATLTLDRLRAEQDSPWPPALQARVLCEALAVGLLDPSDEQLEDLVDLLEQVVPASARLSLVEAFRWHSGSLTTSPFWRQRIVALFPAPVRGRLGFAVKAIRTAHVHRMVASNDVARTLFKEAFEDLRERQHPWGAIQAWDGLRRVMTSQPEIRDFVGGVLTDESRPPQTFADAALVIELLFHEAAMSGPADFSPHVERARAILEKESQPTQWHAKVTALDALIVRSPVEQFEPVGLESFEPLSDLQQRRMPGVPRHRISEREAERLDERLRSQGYDWLAEKLIVSSDDKRWLAEFVDESTAHDALNASAISVQLEVPTGAAAALPWEWVYQSMYRTRSAATPFGRDGLFWVQRALNTCGATVRANGSYGAATMDALQRFARDAGLGDREPTDADIVARLRTEIVERREERPEVPVLVVKARSTAAGRPDVSHESLGGIAVETFYDRKRDVHVLESPDVDELMRTVRKVNPGLIHIACAITERRGLPCLAFEHDAQDSSRLLTARTLCEVFKERKHGGPFVILDLARPSSEWEAVRCLLLRNHFAADVFAVDGVLGVLAMGLVQPRDLATLGEIVGTHVLAGASQRSLISAIQQAQTRRPNAFDQRIGFTGAALFSIEPELPCLAV